MKLYQTEKVNGCDRNENKVIAKSNIHRLMSEDKIGDATLPISLLKHAICYKISQTYFLKIAK